MSTARHFLRTLAALLPLSMISPGGSLAAEGENRPGRSLLEYKLELASDSLPYLHVTSDEVIVYLKNLLLKRLGVERLHSTEARPLRMSRVAGWWISAPRIPRMRL